MNTRDIEQVICKDPVASQRFAGFSFPDAPIELTTFPTFTIINTDLSTGPGEHWCVAYFDRRKHCDYFDPLGFPPDNPLMKYNVGHILTQFNTPVQYMDSPSSVQSIERKTCGDHCTYFALLRCRGNSFQAILKLYYSPGNPEINDRRVVQFTSKYGVKPRDR